MRQSLSDSVRSCDQVHTCRFFLVSFPICYIFPSCDVLIRIVASDLVSYFLDYPGMLDCISLVVCENGVIKAVKLGELSLVLTLYDLWP
jgi:hypothetical protein